MTDPLLLQFWGKTPRPGAPPTAYHPALFHMLDVAVVAEALLRVGPPRLRRALCHAWAGCDPDALVAWLPFLIATHDLGKIAAAFQGQATRHETEAQRARLGAHGVVFGRQSMPLLYHAEISALWLHEYLAHYEPGTAPALVWTLRDAMGGHHGRFTQASMRDIHKRMLACERDEPRWAAWRATAYTLLRELLAPAGSLAALGAPRHVRPATAALTGFLVWCDWMGSNEADFPASPDVPIPQYLPVSRARAMAALARHHLDLQRPPPTYAGYDRLFPDPPRPLQALVDQLSGDDLAEPLLAVIEAPTGEGKTEAALALARRIAAASGVDELFFALPTMATSNQLFVRLQAVLHRHYGAHGAVRLTHSQALAVEDDLRARVALAADSDPADVAGSSADAALEWFAGAKKAMLAPFGVGTVDQIELAGLAVRHYPLRLFGLAGKVVIIDEVHAYDAYMNTILAHTLAWLASLGCSAILLSATLPATRQRALATAFLAGLGHAAPPAPPDPPPYPALALYHAGGQRTATCAVFRGEQAFTLRLQPQREPDDEAQHLLALVRAGGAVARLCNRVDDAQALYRALRARLPAAQRVLLHARFPLDARTRREQQIETLVGRQTTRSADQPLIIVGTQVLEQSLDYDVDVMVTDFAPIDLLLQRAGRLHRHARARPPQHAAPVLEVTVPRDATGAPDWRRWAAIYDPYILWRTWDTLLAGAGGLTRTIALPGAYRPLIEAVYGETQDGDHVPDRARAWERYAHATSAQQAQARRPLTPDVREQAPITEAAQHEVIEDEHGQAANWQLARTRLGDRISVVPVYAAGATLALDRAGTWLLSPDLAPDLELQKALLGRAVPISDRRIIARYRDEGRPRALRWPWPNVPPLLRSLFPLPLDGQHRTVLDGRRVWLDDDLGLVIDKEEL